MADVFISYHRSEGASALARRIAAELESRGVSCWYDTKNKAPVDFIRLILTEIDACKVFLFLWDEESNKEPFYVRREIHTAATTANVRLFPFRVGDFELNPVLKFYFGPINIPYGGDSPETARIEELVDAIAHTLGKATPQPPPPKPSPPPAKVIKSGKCGIYSDNVNFTLDENGVLTISGKGAMRYFVYNNGALDMPWWNERETIAHVEIQDGVTSIGVNAFWCCSGLTSVNISDSVINIGTCAFSGCARLTSVTIPDSVTYIGGSAFGNCNKLTSVSVPAKAQIFTDTFPRTTRIERRA